MEKTELDLVQIEKEINQELLNEGRVEGGKIELMENVSNLNNQE